ERGRYPAVSVLRSVSRVMPNCNTAEENALVTHARRLISRYEDMADMIRLGAYRKGSDAETDEAIARHDALEDFLAQDQGERADLASGYARLAEILAADKKGRGR
ncbi:MAG TPA: flagellum-specific ATP synthase FliI, partial [Alphaproteobacteria bacterium]